MRLKEETMKELECEVKKLAEEEEVVGELLSNFAVEFGFDGSDLALFRVASLVGTPSAALAMIILQDVHHVPVREWKRIFILIGQVSTQEEVWDLKTRLGLWTNEFPEDMPALHVRPEDVRWWLQEFSQAMKIICETM